MFALIQSQIIFYAALAFVMFLPGYFLLLAIFGKNQTISTLERFILSFGLSIVSVDFVLFAFSGLHIPLTKIFILLGILLFSAACFVIYKRKNNCHPELACSARDSGSKKELDSGSKAGMTGDEKLFSFSKNQIILIFLLLILTFFIRTVYLGRTISPNATDLGHHMYWAKIMAETHQLPTYEGMPDFIIGEQTIFGTIAILTNLSFFSAWPAAVLYLIDILSILTVFILTLRIFKEKNVAILTLLFLGVLYAISSPQAKFVSGGVVGNLIGNFLMPLALYFFARAFAFWNEPNSKVAPESKTFLALALFTTFGLFYTHHLTAFIFAFVMLFLILVLFLTNVRNLKELLLKTKDLVLSPAVLAVFFGGLIFFFFVFTPNYVNPSAVNTAVGAPSKNSRAGLTINALKSSIGEVRFGLGLLGFFILAFFYLKNNRRNLGYLIALSWLAIIFLLSTVPKLFFINLPSDRVGNYLSYPLAVLSAYGLFYAFKKIGSTDRSSSLIKAALILTLGFAFTGGLTDSATAIPKQDDYASLVQTFHSSAYLAAQSTTEDNIIKDHNYIAGDSWMKLFFMRGYKYPQSRGYFKRYDDTTKPREMCTLYMISNPAGADALQCFADTGTDFVMINPRYDSAQFRKLQNFDQIYSGSDITIFYRHN